MLRPAFAAMAILLAAPAPAAAHHGWGTYDAGKAASLEGVVQMVRWRNPHIEADIRSGGKVWTVVLGPVPRVAARGLSTEQLKPGAVLRVTGYPRKDGTPEIRAERISVAGKTVEMR
ncbi:DUF6152 family protein [Phenylobacterium sp. VNQ135]|uniref:DUF6152 family protein n=1 Tax=Phenylobacterium sp. VNQ135 TaxID=3400922 RepID=UPI003BFF7EBA